MTTNSKTTVNQDLILAARKGLLPIGDRFWLGGFGNLLRKELSQWWGTRTWWTQILLWALIINGITTIGMIATPGTPEKLLTEDFIPAFFGLSTIAVGIGTITAVQNTIVGEKQLGTAAWVLTKPASRSAFLLAKLASYMIGFWIAGIIVPAVLFYIEARLILHVSLPVMPFLVALDVLELTQLFYLALTMMLGTITNSRGAITGIGIGFLLAGVAATNLVPAIYLVLTPWLLMDIGSGLALGQSLPPFWFIPILATGVEIVVMITVALLRFQKEEF